MTNCLLLIERFDERSICHNRLRHIWQFLLPVGTHEGVKSVDTTQTAVLYEIGLATMMVGAVKQSPR